MIRILIADDHAILRQALNRAFEGIEDLAVVAEAASGDDLLTELRRMEVDVVLLDISMPGTGMLDLLDRLHSKYPDVAILILSTHPEDIYAVRAFKAGADGYIMKDRPLEELVTAVRRVGAGGKYVSAALAENMAVQMGAGIDRPAHEALSDREFQVFYRIADGKTIQEIAAELKVSPKTINTYRSRIMEKMGMKTNSDIIRYAVKHAITD